MRYLRRPFAGLLLQRGRDRLRGGEQRRQRSLCLSLSLFLSVCLCTLPAGAIDLLLRLRRRHFLSLSLSVCLSLYLCLSADVCLCVSSPSSPREKVFLPVRLSASAQQSHAASGTVPVDLKEIRFAALSGGCLPPDARSTLQAARCRSPFRRASAEREAREGGADTEAEADKGGRLNDTDRKTQTERHRDTERQERDTATERQGDT